MLQLQRANERVMLLVIMMKAKLGGVKEMMPLLVALKQVVAMLMRRLQLQGLLNLMKSK